MFEQPWQGRKIWNVLGLFEFKLMKIGLLDSQIFVAWLRAGFNLKWQIYCWKKVAWDSVKVEMMLSFTWCFGVDYIMLKVANLVGVLLATGKSDVIFDVNVVIWKFRRFNQKYGII